MRPGAEPRGWNFAIDRGGTFTDVVGVSPLGELHALKVLSHDPLHSGDPAVRGIESMLAAHDAERGGAVLRVRLGTTVATNALLTRKGDPTLARHDPRPGRGLAHRLSESAGHLRSRDPPASAAVCRIRRG